MGFGADGGLLIRRRIAVGDKMDLLVCRADPSLNDGDQVALDYLPSAEAM